MNKIILSILVLLIFGSTDLFYAQNTELTSPDSNLKITINVNPKLTWSVHYKSNLVLDKSEIALELGNGKILGHGTPVKKVVRSSEDKTIKPVVAQKNSQIEDKYNQLHLEFIDGFAVEFRAYNDGVAYRFVTSLGDEIIVKNEISALNFPQNTTSLFPQEETLISHYYFLFHIETFPDNRINQLL